MMATYACVASASPGCEERFHHPDVQECNSVDGKCAHLMEAGWRPVWARVFLHGEESIGKHLLSRGAWICPACFEKLG
jgi:hypothetical protein